MFLDGLKVVKKIGFCGPGILPFMNLHGLKIHKTSASNYLVFLFSQLLHCFDVNIYLLLGALIVAYDVSYHKKFLH